MNHMKEINQLPYNSINNNKLNMRRSTMTNFDKSTNHIDNKLKLMQD